jgi:hypothetical protein
MTDLITQSMAIAMLSKVLIDIWKYYIKSNPIELPSWIYPVLSVLVSIGIAVLMTVSNGIELTAQVIAQQILVGILSAGQAIGVTELQKRG